MTRNPPTDTPLLRLIAQQIVREYLAELEAQQRPQESSTTEQGQPAEDDRAA